MTSSPRAHRRSRGSSMRRCGPRPPRASGCSPARWPRRPRICDGSRPTSEGKGRTSWSRATRRPCCRCRARRRATATRRPSPTRRCSWRSRCRLPASCIRCTVTRRRRSVTSSRGRRSGGGTASRGGAVSPANGSSMRATRGTPCAPGTSRCSPWPRGSTTSTARHRYWRWRRAGGGRAGGGRAGVRPAPRRPRAAPYSPGYSVGTSVWSE